MKRETKTYVIPIVDMAQNGEEPADELILSGVRVLDFGRYIAGPYCAGLLAELGADVIRVEKVSGSEDRYICPVTDRGEGALFLQINGNKRSLTLNPLKLQGREVVKRLVANTDIVVANMPAESLCDMGIDYASLVKIKPDIILSSQTAFGDAGPYASRSGFDGVAQAMSGATWMSGLEGSPFKSYASWCDFSTGMVAAYGTMAALMYRLKTGRGQEVKSNLLRTAMNVFHFNTIEAYIRGEERKPSGNRSQFGAPADLFRTRDGWVQAQVVGQAMFERWAEMIGEKEWVKDPRLQKDSDRANHGELLSHRMQVWMGSHTTQEALAKLEAASVPAGPLYSPLQTLDDPQVRATGLFEWVDYPGLPKPAPVVRGPVEYSACGVRPRMRAPTLGEHTAQVLSEIGYSSDDIAMLRTQRVV